MPIHPAIQAAAWVIYLLVGLGVIAYVLAVRHVARHGGKVRTGDLELPELLMTMVLAGGSIVLIVGAIQRQAKGLTEVKIENVVPGQMVFVIIAVGILAFLRYARRLRVAQVFGLDQVRPVVALGWSAMLFFGALGFTYPVGFLTKLVLKDQFAQQPLVDLFNQVARQNDFLAMAKIFVVGAVLAPCCEEFLFRGFFYGTWKRYLGPLGAGFLSCTLFAAMHTSLTAFPTLFVLAAGLNLAYERTGSLLVPIGIHAMFNAFSLVVLYVMTRSPVPLPS